MSVKSNSGDDSFSEKYSVSIIQKDQKDQHSPSRSFKNSHCGSSRKLLKANEEVNSEFQIEQPLKRKKTVKFAHDVVSRPSKKLLDETFENVKLKQVNIIEKKSLFTSNENPPKQESEQPSNPSSPDEKPEQMSWLEKVLLKKLTSMVEKQDGGEEAL